MGPSVFRMLFAASIGSAMKTICLWKLEHGGRLGILDQFLGSITITDAIAAQLNLRPSYQISAFLIAV